MWFPSAGRALGERGSTPQVARAAGLFFRQAIQRGCKQLMRVKPRIQRKRYPLCYHRHASRGRSISLKELSLPDDVGCKRPDLTNSVLYLAKLIIDVLM